MAERPKVPPIPYHEPESKPPPVVENVGHISTPPPPQIDPEVERRIRAIEDGHGARITSLETAFRGQADGLTAHVNATVASAIDAKLTEKLAPLERRITSEFAQQNGVLAEIHVYMKRAAGRMHKLAMDSSAEFKAEEAPKVAIDKRIDGNRKHTLAVIATACTVITLLASLIAMAINSQHGQPVTAPNVAPSSHH